MMNNAAWIIGSKIVQSLLGLVVGMMTARYLGPSNYGLISYAAALTAFFVPVMQLGLRSTLVQELIREPQEEETILGTAIGMNLISAFACIVGILAFTMVANRGEQETTLVCGLYSVNLVFQALEMVQYWFQAKLLSKYPSIVSVVSYAVVSIYKILLLIGGRSVYWFALSQAVDYCIIAVGLLWIYHRLTGKRLRFSMKRAGNMLQVSKYYIVSGLMVTIFAHTDTIMLKLMMGQSAAGLYNVAVNCVTMTNFVFGAIIDSSRPGILTAAREDQRLFKERMKQLVCVITYLSLAQCLFFAFGADWFVTFLYGKDYSEAVPALRLVVWYSTFSYLGSVRNVWILARGMQRYLWMINLIGAGGNVVLNWVLIPYLGIEGAALASVATQFVTNYLLALVMPPLGEYRKLLLGGMAPGYLREFTKLVRK